jgi:hypothetical protein
MPTSTKYQKMRKKLELLSCNMMIGYEIYDRFTMEHFTYIASKNDIDDQSLLLATVHLDSVPRENEQCH